MTTETEPIPRDGCDPRIFETGETGRLDLSLPAVPEPSLARGRRREAFRRLSPSR